MRLTRHATVISFSGRREAAEDPEALQDLFNKHQNSNVMFWDVDEGIPKNGVLVDLLRGGVFVVRTEDGRNHEVEPDLMRWEDPSHFWG